MLLRSLANLLNVWLQMQRARQSVNHDSLGERKDNESQPVPSMAEFMTVLIGEQSWSESQLAARSGNYSWLLAEAEAWVFLAAGKSSPAVEIQQARSGCFRRSLDTILSFPEELIMPAFEVLWVWVPNQHLVEYSDIAREAFGTRGDPVMNLLKDTFGGYLPEIEHWVPETRSPKSDHDSQRADCIGSGDSSMDFKSRLDRLLLHFASFHVKPERMMRELARLQSDFKIWNSTGPNKEESVHHSLEADFSSLCGLFFDSERQQRAGRLLSVLKNRESPLSSILESGQRCPQ